MLLPARRPSSKMDTAITLLQHLATLATHDGEPCAKILFQAADYLQDVLDCALDFGEPEAGSAEMADFETLMADLAVVLPEDGQRLHS